MRNSATCGRNCETLSLIIFPLLILISYLFISFSVNIVSESLIFLVLLILSFSQFFSPCFTLYLIFIIIYTFLTYSHSLSISVIWCFSVSYFYLIQPQCFYFQHNSPPWLFLFSVPHWFSVQHGGPHWFFGSVPHCFSVQHGGHLFFGSVPHWFSVHSIGSVAPWFRLFIFPCSLIISCFLCLSGSISSMIVLPDFFDFSCHGTGSVSDCFCSHTIH